MKSKPSKGLLTVAQEISFAKALASNEKTLRERALKKLSKWLSSRSQNSDEFTEEGFMRIWKGLFYCVWMSDKPLVQEDNIESISQLLHCFKDLDDMIKFVLCYFQAMSQAWFSLDGHRIDKYMMLVRRFNRQMLEYMYRLDWEISKVVKLNEALKHCYMMSPLGLILHISDIFMEELAKVGRSELTAEATLEFVKPFANLLANSSDQRLLKSLVNNIFFYLLRQSDAGIKHNLKFEAWKQMGFPDGNIDVMEEVEVESNSDSDHDSEYEDSFDIRAGKVDVIIPPLEFNAKAIIEHLKLLKTNKDTTTKARKQINLISKKYSIYDAGKYPLGTHRIEVLKEEDEDEVIEAAAKRLAEFEEESLDRVKKIKKKINKPVWEISEITEQFETLNNSTSGNWEVTDVIEEAKSNQIDTNTNSKKRKSNKMDEEWGTNAWDTSDQTELDLSTPKRPKEDDSKVTPKTSPILRQMVSSGKKVEFALTRNTIQEPRQYRLSLKKKLQYDAQKMPLQGVLKSTPVNSPINPFYTILSD